MRVFPQPVDFDGAQVLAGRGYEEQLRRSAVYILGYYYWIELYLAGAATTAAVFDVCNQLIGTEGIYAAADSIAGDRSDLYSQSYSGVFVLFFGQRATSTNS